MKTATFTASVWREPNGFVSYCPELGVASAGDSQEHALEMLREAVELYLRNAVALGIDRDLRSAVESGERVSTVLEVAVPWAS